MESSANILNLDRGILTSSYKEEIKRNIRTIRSHSLSKIKNKVKSNSSLLCCEAGTILKVSLFVLALIIIAN